MKNSVNFVLKKALIGLLAATFICTLVIFGALRAESRPQTAYAAAYVPLEERDPEETVDPDHTDSGSSEVKISVITEEAPQLKTKVYYFETVEDGWKFLTEQISTTKSNPAEVRLLQEEAEVDSTLQLTPDSEKFIVVDLNGKTLKSGVNKPVFTLNGGDVLVTDSGPCQEN